MKTSRILLATALLATGCSKKEDTRTLAARVVELTSSQEQMQQSWESGLKPAMDRLKSQGLPDDVVASIRAESLKFFADNFKWDEVKPKAVDLFAKSFSDQELQDMVAFYGSPTGKTVVAKMPGVMQELTAAGMVNVQKKMPELQRKAMTLIQEYRRKQASARAAANPPAAAGARPAPKAPGPGLPQPQSPGMIRLPQPSPTPVPPAAQAPVPAPAPAH